MHKISLRLVYFILIYTIPSFINLCTPLESKAIDPLGVSTIGISTADCNNQNLQISVPKSAIEGEELSIHLNGPGLKTVDLLIIDQHQFSSIPSTTNGYTNAHLRPDAVLSPRVITTQLSASGTSKILLDTSQLRVGEPLYVQAFLKSTEDNCTQHQASTPAKKVELLYANLKNPYACLDGASKITKITEKPTQRLPRQRLQTGEGIDLRGLQGRNKIEVPLRSQTGQHSNQWWPLVINNQKPNQGEPRDIRVAGGEFIATLIPPAAGWRASYQNNKAVKTETVDTSFCGIYASGTLDGGSNNRGNGVSHGTQITHSWFDKITDDAWENDHTQQDVTFKDVLWLSSWSGWSYRPGSESKGNMYVYDSILTITPKLYPHRSGKDTCDYQGIPFGSSNIFKASTPATQITPHLVRTMIRVPGCAKNERMYLLPAHTICEDVTVIWQDPRNRPYPGQFQIPEKCRGELTILQGDQGRQAWVAAVSDWFNRHPELTQRRKLPKHKIEERWHWDSTFSLQKGGSQNETFTYASSLSEDVDTLYHQSSVDTTIFVSHFAGPVQTAKFSVSNLPAGITARFSSQECLPFEKVNKIGGKRTDCLSRLILTASDSAIPGEYTLDINTEYGGTKTTREFYLYVKP